MANKANKAQPAQHNAHVLVHAAQPAAPAVVAQATPAKGAATAARWFKPKHAGNPFAGLSVAQAKALVLAMPHTTVITCNVAHNPKGGNSNAVFNLYFGPQPTVGATTTLGAFLQAMAKGGKGVAPSTPAIAAGHIVWDTTRAFCALTTPSA